MNLRFGIGEKIWAGYLQRDCGTVLHVEFAQDATDVVFDCLFGDD